MARRASLGYKATMDTTVVLTIIGADRPGVVDLLANTVARMGGSWLESRMAQLGGRFAGILRVSVPAGAAPGLRAALAALKAQGLTVVVEDGADDTAFGVRRMRLELVGHDHPGIVRDLSSTLAARGVNVVELETGLSSAPMSGERLCRAEAELEVPTTTDLSELRTALAALEDALVVDIVLGDAPPVAAA